MTRIDISGPRDVAFAGVRDFLAISAGVYRPRAKDLKGLHDH
ncbi:MAG: hypothetical protein WBD07_05535 [Vicinamibacterales bacterium]